MEIRRLGLYLHIPFCVRKCGYCDFLSAPADRETKSRYVQALCRQTALYGKRLRDAGGNRFAYAVDTVFLGGGTPSLLSAESVQQILDCVRENFIVSPDAEITLECNPKTAGREKLAGFCAAGVNRLSIGLQSADNGQLACLGRIHSWEDFLELWKASQEAGFVSRNVDLMSALPGQTVASLADTLKKVIALEPEHISAYSLIVEEGTPFYALYADGRGLPSEEEAVAMDTLIHRVMERAGYERYEISNYARPGYACRHNLKYWSQEEYLGLGTGAVSCMKKDCGLYRPADGRDGSCVRSRCISDTKEYIRRCEEETEKDLFEETEFLTRRDEMEEFLFLGLRKAEGFSVSEFETRFGIPFGQVGGKTADRYLDQGLLRWEYDRVFLTEEGMEVSNRIMADFLLD